MASKRFLTLAVVCALALVAGCGSSTKSPTVVDTAPPAMPTGLWVTTTAGAVTVNWDPNTTDADFAGFRLARVVSGSTTRLVDAPADITGFTDTAPARGTVNRYLVTSVDASGNESACAAISATLSPRHEGPTPFGGFGEEGAGAQSDQPPLTHEDGRMQH